MLDNLVACSDYSKVCFWVAQDFLLGGENSKKTKHQLIIICSQVNPSYQVLISQFTHLEKSH